MLLHLQVPAFWLAFNGCIQKKTPALTPLWEGGLVCKLCVNVFGQWIILHSSPSKWLLKTHQGQRSGDPIETLNFAKYSPIFARFTAIMPCYAQTWNLSFHVERTGPFSFCKRALPLESLWETSGGVPRRSPGGNRGCGLQGLCVIPGRTCSMWDFYFVHSFLDKTERKFQDACTLHGFFFLFFFVLNCSLRMGFH